MDVMLQETRSSDEKGHYVEPSETYTPWAGGARRWDKLLNPIQRALLQSRGLLP